jgi:hypothetical protein
MCRSPARRAWPCWRAAPLRSLAAQPLRGLPGRAHGLPGRAHGLPGRARGPLGVHPVDRGLMRLAPCPEGQRRGRGQERPAVRVWSGRAQGPHQRGMALPEPFGQLGIGGSLAEDLLLRRAGRAGQPLRDETRRPPVHVTRVLEQVPDRPGRAGRYLGGQAGPLRRAGEQFPLAAQCQDVAGNVERGIRGLCHVRKDATTARHAFRCAGAMGR